MKRRTRLVAVLLAASMVAGGCGASTGGGNTSQSDSSSVNSGGSTEASVVNMNIESEPPTLCSLDCYDVVSMNVLRHVMEGLTRLDDDNNVIPGIAEKWDVSEDELTYTFHLRDAKWSNGDPVTADDFVFGWQKMLDPEYGAVYSYLYYDIKGAKDYNTGTGSLEDVAIKAIDDKTLEVVLERPTPYFDFLCAQASFLPINQKFYESLDKDGSNLYGTEAENLLFNGPFVITRWDHDSKITVEKNADYYGADDIKLDTVNMEMVSDANTAYNMFVGGELDMVSLNTGDQIAQAEKDGYEVLTKSNGATYYFEFNLSDPTLANENIRKALAYAVDRKSLTENILKDSSTAALSFTNPDITANGSSFQAQVGDIIKDGDSEAAKAALAQGMKELGITELPKLTLTISDKDSDKTQAAAYQEYWKQNLGLEVEVLSMPYKSQLSAIKSGDYQICFTAWGPDYNDPSTFLDVFSSGSGMNDTGYASEEYDKLLVQAKAETDPAKRSELFVQAEQKLLEDMPIAPITFYNRAYLVSDHLKGLYRSSFQDIDFVNAYIQ